MSKILSMGKGDVITHQGDEASSIFLLTKGKLNVIIRNPNGMNSKVGEIHAGELFGEMAYILKKPRSATVIADEPSEVVEISKEIFDATIANNPKWLERFIFSLVRRLEDKNNYTKTAPTTLPKK